VLNAIQNQAKEKMQKAVEALKTELSKLRTGRAHPSLLEHIHVDYYGSSVPLSQVGNISVENARMLTITIWEKALVQTVEKALLTSDLGLNPSTAGMTIRVPLPPLTQERRKELAKGVHASGEMSKVAVRNIRKDAKKELASLLKDKAISEDDERRAETVLQKSTDQAIADIDKVIADKEKDLMEI
jgi:ribosome recycling factor